MNSIKELYRIGYGPSSSHTMALARAAKNFLAKNLNAFSFRAYLGGSLALTGKGHLTDIAIMESFKPKKVEIVWQPDKILNNHANGFRFEALNGNGDVIAYVSDCSVGGGALQSDGEMDEVYKLKSLTSIIKFCNRYDLSLWEFVKKRENDDFWDYLGEVWATMYRSIDNGLSTKGVLPGGLQLKRRAADIKRKSISLRRELKAQAQLASYAYAVAEENAGGGIIVAAPTCGSCGILPAVLRYFNRVFFCVKEEIINALATAGLIGNLAKHNASISGAVAGCQAEVGVACAMAAAAAAQMLGGSIEQIEYAAEMGLEHHFGLTCDPVKGLVQIPCIERNAHAAERAFYCANFALLSDGKHRISYDDALSVMMETGINLSSQYKETSIGGLATIYHQNSE